jgi:hypothetical protein
MSAKSLLNDSFIAMFERVTERPGPGPQEADGGSDGIGEAGGSGPRRQGGRPLARARPRRSASTTFGAGASSLPYLQQLTVDLVKIDGVYIRNIHASAARARDRGRRAHHLQMPRHPHRWPRWSRKRTSIASCSILGVDLGQGWLYGRPAAEIPPPAPARFGKRMGAKEAWG